MKILPKQAEKPRMITQNPKIDRRDWNGQMTQKPGLGFGFTKNACFVCGSYSYLIKDCDFHEKRMAKKSVLKNIGKNTGQREIRPIWNSAQRINHQNKFVLSAVLTGFGRVPVSAAKQSSPRATTSTSTFRPVNTVTHTNRVNVSKLRTNSFHKSHSPIRRPFYKSTAPNTRISNEKVNNVRVNGVNTAGQTSVNVVKGNGVTAIKASAGCVWRPKMTDLNNGNSQQALKNKEIFDSGCSKHMTGNKDFLTDYQDIDGGFVAFGGSARGGKITGKGKIRTDKLDFEDVFFVNELKFNLFFVSQMCDKKNSVLFTETECLVLSPDFKLLDESQVLLRVPRQSNMYSFDLKNVVPSGDLTCLFAKATIDESKLWHRRLGHVNFKTMNKLVKGNLVRGLPSKIFDNDHTCVACQKGKQHKASCKAKLMSSISQPLQMLHMDLFGPTSVRSINHKTYCLVVTDDFSRFSWVFFLASKDETSGILKRFITEIENQLNHKVKVIRCDNGTEFKNREMNEFSFSDNDYAGASLDRNPKREVVNFMFQVTTAEFLISEALFKRRSIKNDWKEMQHQTEVDEGEPIHFVAYETVYQKVGRQNGRAATTDSSLEAEHDSGSGPRCQVTILGLQMLKLGLRMHLNSTNDPLLLRVKTLGSEEDSLKLMELMAHCTKLSEWQVKQVKTITEASLRRHLKLEDSDGITSLPNTEFFEQLALMGSGSGTIHKTPTRPHDSPLPKVQSLGSDAGRMTLSELTVLCTNLSNKGRMIEDINEDTNTILVTLTKVSSQSDQSEDHLKVLSAAKVLADVARKRREVANVTPYTRRKRKISTASGDISTAEEPVNTAGASKPVSTADMVQERVKDKGKAIMQESEQPRKIKKKEYQQISLDEEIAQKLYAEELAKDITSVPQDLGVDKAVHKEEVTVWKGLSLLLLA
ncbi:putative ribonuclease H-like domain-containing protein [Tanacetum coccineum]